ncbi:MAG: hypothetical protein ACYCXQ_00910 [Candidatus Humimicrobiaceae bacterium]
MNNFDVGMTLGLDALALLTRVQQLKKENTTIKGINKELAEMVNTLKQRIEKLENDTSECDTYLDLGFENESLKKENEKLKQQLASQPKLNRQEVEKILNKYAKEEAEYNRKGKLICSYRVINGNFVEKFITAILNLAVYEPVLTEADIVEVLKDKLKFYNLQDISNGRKLNNHELDVLNQDIAKEIKQK